mgnify:FL=1
MAIGEVGLDYYYQPKNKEQRKEYRQKQWNTLSQQVDLALELDLPVIFHCRVAFPDLLSFITEKQAGKLRGVIHSYTGDSELAKQFIDLGMYIGFNGLIFKDVASLPNPEEVIANIPLDRIVLETDAPYLVPPEAGVERNEPSFVQYVAKEIARIKKEELSVVAKETTQNAKTLFGI